MLPANFGEFSRPSFDGRRHESTTDGWGNVDMHTSLAGGHKRSQRGDPLADLRLALGSHPYTTDMHRGGHGLWDYAASALVCIEAGAVVADVFGRDLFTPDPTERRSPIAAATQELFDAFLEARLKDG